MHARSLYRLAILIALNSSAMGSKAAFDVAGLLHRRTETLQDMVDRRADEITDAHVVPRMPQSAPAALTQSATANLTGSDPSSIDQAQMDATISAACNAALGPIKSVSNDAGLLGCYNIPFLNTNTGVFEADLRLYQLYEPKGAFAGVKSTDILVQVSYPNASFSTIPPNAQNAKSRSDLERRQNPGNMNELQNFLFVGQVSKKLSLSKLKE